MKLKKSMLERLIKEELAFFAKSLLEADGEEDKKPKKPDTQDANAEKGGEKKAGPGPGRPPGVKNKPKDAAPPAPEAPPEEPTAPEEEVPDVEDPADDELSKEREDGEGDDDRGGGKISDEITGKRIQSVVLEPKSKAIPGAMELVISFEEIPDPLKVIITKTGQVKFWFRGLHNQL